MERRQGTAPPRRPPPPATPWRVAAMAVLGTLVVMAVADHWRPAPASVDATVDGVTSPAPARVEPALADARAHLPTAVRRLDRFAAEQRDRLRGEPTQGVAADGVRRVADAFATIADARGVLDPALRAELARAGELADSLQWTALPNRYARNARRAFLATATAVVLVQERGYPDLAREAGAVRRAARRLQPSDLLFHQHGRVVRFFDRAAAAARAMTLAGTPTERPESSSL